MPEYALVVHFGAPDDEHAAKRGEDIADRTAAEFGTRHPEVHRINRDEDHPVCAFCEAPAAEHPEPLCSPGVVRELRAELAALKATMAGDYAEKIEQIHAERAAMPEAERIRHEVADAPLLRIQLARVATERKALKAAEGAWRDAQTGLFHAREEALCRAVAAENRAEQAEAAIARIRTAVINTYGEDYGGEDVAAEIERLLRHLSEYETDARRILQAKNEALEQAEAERDAAHAAIAPESQEDV